MFEVITTQGNARRGHRLVREHVQPAAAGDAHAQHGNLPDRIGDKDIRQLLQVFPAVVQLGAGNEGDATGQPVPVQVGQAPYGLLNENMRGVNSSMEIPQSSHA